MGLCASKLGQQLAHRNQALAHTDHRPAVLVDQEDPDHDEGGGEDSEATLQLERDMALVNYMCNTAKSQCFLQAIEREKRGKRGKREKAP